jgi:hypothetical protein
MRSEHIFLSFLIIIATSLIIGCASTENVKNAPPFEVLEHSLSRGIEDKGTESVPIGRSTVFSVEDGEVNSYIKLANVSGKHKIRWDWYRPDGKVYTSTGNKLIQVDSGMYREAMSIWHKISLYKEEAAAYPGRWLVNISLDNDVIYSSHFEVTPEINIDILPKFVQKTDPSAWGLIIGIENYMTLPSVQFAVKDARLVRRYFEAILGVPQENIITLIDSEATKGKIAGLIQSYLKMNVDSNTRLYVYFAGHGMPSLRDGDAFICTYDADPRFIEHTGYKLEELYSDIGKLPLKNAIIFIDSCFSGSSSRSGQMLLADARPALIKVDNIKLTSDKIISLAASKGDQISSSYKEKEHGLFTYFMLKGLRGPADTDEDKEISVQELYHYVNKQVGKVSRRKGIEQTPIILPGFDFVKDIAISKVLEE